MRPYSGQIFQRQNEEMKGYDVKYNFEMEG